MHDAEFASPEPNRAHLLAILIGAVFSCWASYRIHILPIEETAFPILEAIINLQGRAPDQYRVLPYFIIRVINDLWTMLPIENVGLRAPILIFDTISLFLAALLLRLMFPRLVSQSFIWLLFLIYPMLMFDGYRPISAFILLVSLCCLRGIQRAHDPGSTQFLSFYCAILLLSFTRADIALLYAILYLASVRPPVANSVLTLLTPPIAQCFLMWIIFPEAQYFSAVIMLQENLRGTFIISSPLSYLVVAVVIYNWQGVRHYCHTFVRKQPVIATALCAYILTLLIVARPNEYRLFLPLLPIVLWQLERQRDERAYSLQDL